MRRTRREDGEMALELSILAPVLIVLVLLLAAGARTVLAQFDVNEAAYSAARAASLERAPGAASGAGSEAATRMLSDRGPSCSQLSIDVDVSRYEASGQVRATVTCVTQLKDLVLLGVPGSKTYRATAVVPIEQFRAE